MSYGWDRGRVKTTPGRPSTRYSDLRASAVVPEQSAPSSRLRCDGAAGLSALKQCGGITVVQDPSDAAIGRVPNGSMLSWAFPEAAR